MVDKAKTNNKPIEKVLEGDVVSDKMDKTIVVKTVRSFIHPLVQKVVRVSKKYKVHDEENRAKIGDRVEFKEVRPISKLKYMKLSRIIKSSIEK